HDALPILSKSFVFSIEIDDIFVAQRRKFIIRIEFIIVKSHKRSEIKSFAIALSKIKSHFRSNGISFEFKISKKSFSRTLQIAISTRFFYDIDDLIFENHSSVRCEFISQRNRHKIYWEKFILK